MENLNDEEKRKIFMKVGISIAALVVVTIIGIIIVLNR